MGNERVAVVPNLAPELIELAGRCAFPVFQALEQPQPPVDVARNARPWLEELAVRADAPREVAASARRALIAARRLCEGDRNGGYADFLAGMRELLDRTGLPVPVELA